MSWESDVCQTNGINTHYLRTGGDKPPVILLHGLMLSGACWTPLARTLEEDYDVIMPDARGHGLSSAPTHGYHYQALAHDVIGLIETLELTAPILLGHSMGGMTAAMVANKKPIKKIILADPTFLTPERQRDVYKSNVAEQHRQVLKRSKENFLAEMMVRHSHRSPEIIRLFTEARYQTSIHAFQILTPPNPDYLELIHNLNVPGLLIIGDSSPVVSDEMATKLAEVNNQLEVAKIKDAGHAIPYDQPEQFAAIVKFYLNPEKY